MRRPTIAELEKQNRDLRIQLQIERLPKYEQPHPYVNDPDYRAGLSYEEVRNA